MFVAVLKGYLEDKPNYSDIDLAYHLRLKQAQSEGTGYPILCPSNERVSNPKRVQHILDGDRLQKVARGLGRPFALHDRGHRQLLVREAIGLHEAQHRDREPSRRPHWPIGLLRPFRVHAP